MAHVTLFSSRDRGTFLCRVNPGLKLIALLSLSIAVSSANGTYPIALFLFLIPYSVFNRLPLIKYIKEGWLLLLIALLIALTEKANGSSGLGTASAVSAFLSVVLMSLLLADTSSPSGIARSLGSMLSRIFGQFGWKAASMVELTLSMIPMILEDATALHEARISRGDSFLLHPIRSTAGYSVMLTSRLLDKVGDYADSLSSRFYSPGESRTAPSYSLCDLAFTISVLIIILGRAWIK